MLAEHLKTQRRLKGFTQDRLAEAAGLSKRTIARIEGGSPVQAETLLAVCSVLGLDHGSLERIRTDEEANAPAALPVITSGSPSVATGLVPDAVASLSDTPGIEFLALPDLAAWRSTRNPWRNDDLGSMLFAAKARFWARAQMFGIPAFLAIVVASAMAMTWGINQKTTAGWVLAAIVFVVTLGGGCAALYVAVNGWVDRRFDAEEEAVVAVSVYAFSGDSVRLVTVEDARVRVFRHDLSGIRNVRRTENGGLVSYHMQTNLGPLALHALPLDPRIDGILMRRSREDLVRLFERPVARAA